MNYGDKMYRVRKYIPSDKERLRFICKETTWDANKKKENKLESIPMIFNDYFTEYEHENIFVAVNDENIPVGYVICSSNSELFREKMKNDIRHRVRKTYAPSLLMFYATYFAVLLTKKEYRTHLHIDLLPEAQRQGLGTKLIDSLCEHLKKNGIKNVSVLTIDKSSMGYKFYTKYGFRIFKSLTPSRVSMTFDIK